MMCWRFWGLLHLNLGGGNSKIFGIFPPIYLGKIPILTNIFQGGLKPPTRNSSKKYNMNWMWSQWFALRRAASRGGIIGTKRPPGLWSFYNSSTTLETNMTLEPPPFSSIHFQWEIHLIFKCGIFHCHVGFRRCRDSCAILIPVDSHQHISDFRANLIQWLIAPWLSLDPTNQRRRDMLCHGIWVGGFKHDFWRWYNLPFKRDSKHHLAIPSIILCWGLFFFPVREISYFLFFFERAPHCHQVSTESISWERSDCLALKWPCWTPTDGRLVLGWISP